MKISFNSWVYCSFPTWLPVRSLEDAIAELADLGYDGIEIGGAAPHGYPDYLDGARRKEILDYLHSRNLQVSAICPALGGGPGFNPVSEDEPERQAGIKYMEACIRLAADLECPHVIWLGGYRRYRQSRSEAWEYAVENLQACAAVAKEVGVVLAVEPTSTDSNMLEHAGDCLRIIEDAGVDEDVAGVMLDTAHVFNRNDELRDAFREAGERLVYVHIADTRRDPPGTHHHFGTLIDELRDIGYDGWLSLEIGFNRREVDPGTLARVGLAHMREVLEGSPDEWAQWHPAAAAAAETETAGIG
jgi:protein FrlC